MQPVKVYVKTLTNGFIKENPVLRLVLGTCPTLAISTNVLDGLGMGVAATFVLICSNVVISLLRKVIPDKVRLPAYIVVIAGFTTIVQLLVKAYLPALNESLGIFLPLIVVNCIILGRAEAFAGKNSVGLSALDGLGMGVGFTGALALMGLIREFFGSGSVFGWPQGGHPFAVAIFVMPAGGFFVFGTLIWLTNKLSKKFGGRSAVPADPCAVCPAGGFCARKVPDSVDGAPLSMADAAEESVPTADTELPEGTPKRPASAEADGKEGDA